VGGCSPAVDGRRTKLPVPELPGHDDLCGSHYEQMLAYIRGDQGTTEIILASSWSSVSDTVKSSVAKPGLASLKVGVDNAIADLRAIAPTIPIALLSDVPRWEIDPIPCVLSQQSTLLRRRCQADRERLDMSIFNRYQRPTHDLMRSYQTVRGVVVISPEDYLCTETDCTAVINGEFIYRDAGHLRRNLKPATFRQFADLLHFGELFSPDAKTTTAVLGGNQPEAR
jgi:hypothetical protein